jgi:hypothetical protein
MQINDPAIIAELSGLHEVYEKALIANDVLTLEALFWGSPHAIRYGVTENLYGVEEIRAFRRNRPATGLARTINRLEIIAAGHDAGIVNVEFQRVTDGVERNGRQTQFWLRFEQGWRIVSAHVSLLPVPASYVEAAAREAGIPLHAADRAAIDANFDQTAAAAKFLMEFRLSQDVEAAPVFRP